METDNYYRALIRASLDGFWLLDGQGRFMDVNDAYCALVGYSREEILNLKITDLDANETPEVFAEHLKSLKASGNERFETKHRARDGRLLDVEVSANYDRNSDSAPLYDNIFVFIRDVTEQRAANLSLRQRTHDLSERVKELNCLITLSTLIARREMRLEVILQQAVEILPSAWQYPEIAAACLVLPGRSYRTDNFSPSPWRMSCEFDINENSRGELIVVYLEQAPEAPADPFLPEEYALLEVFAQRLGGLIRRRRAEQALILREGSLNSLLDLSQQASTMREEDIIQLALEEVERLTLSQIGYLHFVNPGQDSIHLFTWSRHTLQQCTAAHDSHYPLEQAGIWADCARLKRPVIHNDYQNCPDKKGYPVGHTHLIRHLSVPVVENNVVHLIMGVGNKPVDYDEADVRQILLTAEHLWRIVRRRRAEQKAQQESERVATMAHMATLLNAHLDLAAIFQIVCEETARALRAPSASLCLYEPDNLVLVHTSNLAEHPDPSGQIIQTELTDLLSHNPWKSGDFILQPSKPGSLIGALAAVHIAGAEQVLGVLVVYNFGQPQLWTEDESALLQGLAGLAGQAITKARLFAEVSQSQEQLQTLSRRQVEIQETERRYIARELHDEVGQVLTAVKINLQTLRRQPVLNSYAPRLDENIQSVQRALEQVRNISLNLRPSVLDDLGLSAALEWYTQRMAHSTDLDIQLALPENAPRWSPTIEITCFRIVQEALTNIIRHAHAQHVWISVRHTPSQVYLNVRDDGVGFDPTAARLRAARSGSSVGLLSMAERVALSGGQLKIESAPGQGTMIQVQFNAAMLETN